MARDGPVVFMLSPEQQGIVLLRIILIFRIFRILFFLIKKMRGDISKLSANISPHLFKSYKIKKIKS
jgi:hypothetical protein